MKKIILLFILIIGVVDIGFSQQSIKNHEIKLGSPDGISCVLDNHMQEYYVNGFDVDKQGNIYLVCSDSEGQKYLYKYDSKLQLKEKTKLPNNYSWVLCYDDDVLAYEHIPRLNYYIKHRDDSVKIEHSIQSLDLQNDELVVYTSDVKRNKKEWIVLSLPNLGQKETNDNPYGITGAVKEHLKGLSVEYKGKVNDLHVICKFISSDAKHPAGFEITTVDDSGKIVSSQTVYDTDLSPDIVCTNLGCNIEILRILRNGHLYFLGANKANNSFIVSEISIDELITW